MRAGKYEGWLPTLFVGQLLQNKTVGIVGAGVFGGESFASGARLHQNSSGGSCVIKNLASVRSPAPAPLSFRCALPPLVSETQRPHRRRLCAHDGGGPQDEPGLLRPLPQQEAGGVHPVGGFDSGWIRLDSVGFVKFGWSHLPRPTNVTNEPAPPKQPRSKYGELLRHSGEAPVAVRRVETVEEVLREADVSLTGV
jgi:hypothetical protein